MREILRGESNKEVMKQLTESRSTIEKLTNEKKALEDKVVSLLKLLGSDKRKNSLIEEKYKLEQSSYYKRSEEEKKVVKKLKGELSDSPRKVQVLEDAEHTEDSKELKEESKDNVCSKGVFTKYRAEVRNTTVQPNKDKASLRKIVNFYANIWNNDSSY